MAPAPKSLARITRELAATSDTTEERDARIVALARKGYPTEAIADLLGYSEATVRRVRVEFGVAARKPAGPAGAASSSCPKCGSSIATARVNGQAKLVDVEVREVVVYHQGSDVGELVLSRAPHGPTCLRIQLERERTRQRDARRR